MPANYPPIAPRGPSAATRDRTANEPSESLTQELQTAGDAGQAARLALLESDPASFVDAHHPVRDALTIALLKPAADLIKRHTARQRLAMAAAAAPLDSDDPTERPMTLAPDDGLTGLQAMAETHVVLAIQGDVKAFNAIADRVEGKAGLRKADLDAETAAQRERVRGTIEELVREMTERRRIQSDGARVIDATIVDDE